MTPEWVESMRDSASDTDMIGAAPEKVLVLTPLAVGMIGIAVRAEAGERELGGRPDDKPEND